MGSTANATVQEIVGSFARWGADSAAHSVNSLLSSFGSKTEPDFTALVPSYNRMLAMALLLAGTFMAAALIEQMLGGTLGAGWSVIPRAGLAVFVAFAGLTMIGYASEHAVLLSDSWSTSVVANNNLLRQSSAALATSDPKQLPLGSVAGLILTSLLTMLLSLLVYLELILRAGLLLVLTAFIPFVSVMGIWPRLAGAAAQLGEFLFALLLSKFVMATAIFVGYSLVVAGLHADGTGRHADLMLTGLAILAVTAFAPLLLVQGLRFGHATTGNLVRGWGARGASAVAGVQIVRVLAQPMRVLAAGVSRRSQPWRRSITTRAARSASEAGRRLYSSSWLNRLRRRDG